MFMNNTKTMFCILFMASLLLSVNAQTYTETPDVKSRIDLKPDMTVLLYPEGQAAGKGIVENGKKITFGPKEDNGLRGPEICNSKGSRRNIGDDARMDFYFPKHNATGQMVIMTLGGGFFHVSTFNEGAYGSKWLTEHGVAVCVLKYRMPNGHKTVPLDDVQNAFRYCRYHAKEWGVKQLGVMGGSAGGYLAASASVYWTDSITRPDFSVLIYPRLKFITGEPCNTRDNLIGAPDLYANKVAEYEKLQKELSPGNFVNAQTPPAFIILSADDKSVPADNMIDYYTGLIKNGVSTELHVFPGGGHGWGFSSEDIVGKGKDKFVKYRKEFYALLSHWLKERAKDIK